MGDTRSQWLHELERLSPAGYNLSATLNDAVYVDRPVGQKPHFRDADAFNFASSDAHNRLVVVFYLIVCERVAGTPSAVVSWASTDDERGVTSGSVTPGNAPFCIISVLLIPSSTTGRNPARHLPL
jgi:hypothetical protein